SCRTLWPGRGSAPPSWRRCSRTGGVTWYPGRPATPSWSGAPGAAAKPAEPTLASGRPGRVADPARRPYQPALAPLVVVEQIRAGQQHPGVVSPDPHQLVALLLGLLDHPPQPALGMGAEVRPDPVGGVDVQAVQREPASRAAAVHGQLEEGE